MTTLMLGLCSISLVAGEPTNKIPAGAKMYVDAEKGFDSYLIAALTKKKVPLQVVADKSAAEYVIEGYANHEDKNWASKVFLGHRDTSEATIKVIYLKTSEVVYAYAVHKKNSVRANQSTAEACAKHLKSIVAKQ